MNLTISHKHRKHSSVMGRVIGPLANILGSMPGQFFKFLVNLILLNLSN